MAKRLFKIGTIVRIKPEYRLDSEKNYLWHIEERLSDGRYFVRCYNAPTSVPPMDFISEYMIYPVGDIYDI